MVKDEKIWKLRNKMVGMKNLINKERITREIIKVIGELEEEEVTKIEVMMDYIKYQWKFVLKEK